MKNLILILSFLICSISYADAGDAYRFNLILTSNSGETITGYFYHYTYDTFDKSVHRGNKFKSFIKKDSIDIYSYINSVNVENGTVDFTTNRFKRTINLENIDRISIADYLDFIPSSKLVELSENEFNLIQLSNPKTESIYNEEHSENCAYILISWNTTTHFNTHKNEINDKLIWMSKDISKHQDEFYKYLNLKKSELLEDDILLISVCGAL